ncbi:hypothetical protein [Ornithinibacillus bavariensis]|uniref:Uncharacterized protein n=1 Tax=Ornithinibacillus bavariensis TaxID=545502 RepID=A0A919X7Y9_9BACI|nr:hypothetical protein [Ornithinibacillus bavariensis]GIO27647.1 hypothetical protein J43TS3_22580 [Ornithinibacillus bavariensis]
MEMTLKELRDMGTKVKEEFNPYPSFEVNFISVYKEFESEKYIKFLDIPLEGKRKTGHATAPQNTAVNHLQYH